MAKTDQTDYPIDFVLLWVDDSDPQWRALRKQYAPKDHFLIDDREARYRDFETLRYWFRAVEKFAPWVNKIYFITCGHVPAWLNLDAQKLVHVKHSDYIPEEYPLGTCTIGYEMEGYYGPSYDYRAISRKLPAGMQGCVIGIAHVLEFRKFIAG